MLSEVALSKVKYLPKGSIVIEVTRSKKHILSPSWKVLNQYKKDKDWNRYVANFRKEMRSKECRDEMECIAAMAQYEDVYLACFEVEGNCHRFLLLDWINLIIKSTYL